MTQTGTKPAETTEETTPEAQAAVKPPGWLSKIFGRIAGFLNSRQPRLVPSLFCLAGVLILLGLGTWQMQRLSEKNALLKTMQVELAGPANDLRAKAPGNEEGWKAMAYRPVLLEGQWLGLHSFKLAPRTFEEQVGYQLIVPLKLRNGQIVLVNRGFVPDGAVIVPEDGKEAVLRGVAFVPVAEKPRFVPENIPSRGLWVWLDLPAMAHEVGIARTAPVIVYEDRVTDRDAYPIGGQVPLPSHNRHWHYAVTWYCLALALMGVWMTASGPKPQTEDKQPHVVTEDDRLNDPVARRGMYPEATD